jgi:hypothetical protein
MSVYCCCLFRYQLSLEMKFVAFLATEYDEVFSGYQPGQMVERWGGERFEDHLCPRPQGISLVMVGKNILSKFIPGPACLRDRSVGRFSGRFAWISVVFELIRLDQLEKSAVAKHGINIGHQIDFDNVSVLDRASGYMDCLVKKAIQIRLNQKNFNREQWLYAEPGLEPRNKVGVQT